MAHYAFLDDNNVVVDVICGRDEDDLPDGIDDWEKFYGAERGMRCLRTSVNTLGNRHLNGKTPFRYNYAVIGGTYDEERDAFIEPRPDWDFELDPETLMWVDADPYPMDGYCYQRDGITEKWVRVGPDLPVPDMTKNWGYDDETGVWEEVL